MDNTLLDVPMQLPEYLTTWVDKNLGLCNYLNHFQIAEFWAANPDKIYTQENPYWKINKDYERLREQAVVNGDLEAETSISNQNALGGLEVIPNSLAILSQIRDGWLGKTFVIFIITRNNFHAWLGKTNQWPLADGCLLNKWFNQEIGKGRGKAGDTFNHQPCSHSVIHVQGDLIQGEKTMSTINQTISGTVHGSAFAAGTINNYPNTVQQSSASEDIKTLLTDLLNHIAELNGKVPAGQVATVEQLSRETQTLVTEINSAQPRKRYGLLSLEGIKEAAIQLGETAAPIMALAEKISPFLQGFV